MSELLRVGYVVEGVTDLIVINTLVAHFLGDRDYVPQRIQPPQSDYADNLGPLGGGWRGVLRWCSDKGKSSEGLRGSLDLANCDYLIIHVDADIAKEAEFSELDLLAPCPPAKDTCNGIRKFLTSLLGESLPPNVIFCIPAQCTEAWVFAALHPDLLSKFHPIECRLEVEKLLIGKQDRLVRSKGNGTDKQVDKYRYSAPKIAKNWSQATAACTEALRFERECRALLNENV